MINTFLYDEAFPIVTHYKLTDGRIWSVEQAKFVDSINEFDVLQKDVISLERLISALEFYGYEKGELKTDAEYASEVRTKRNQLLAETDYLIMPDYPLANEMREAVLAYRQSLRDIPEQAGFPHNINWPEKNF